MTKPRQVRRKRDQARTSFYVPRDLLRAARVHAAQRDMRLREVFLRALRAYLAKHKEDTP